MSSAPLWFALALGAAGCDGCGPKRGPDGSVIIQDFERSPAIHKWPSGAPGAAEVSAEWHADGARSLKIGPGVMASFTALGVEDWTAFGALRFQAHSAADATFELGIEIQDEHTEFSDRYQSSAGVLPGDRAITVDLAGGLWRGEENRPYRGARKDPLNLRKITRLGFTNRGRADVFLDRFELLRADAPKAPGAFAFDFGKEGTRVMSGTTGVFETTLYTPERGFGMLGPTKAWLGLATSYPTALLGDGLGLDQGFRVDLPGGPYLGWIAFERGGFWEREASGYRHAALSVNGAIAHEHDFTPAGPHFLFEDTELTSLDAIEERLVRPAAAIARFRFEAKAGGNVFTVATTEDNRVPLRVAGLFLAPDTAEGRAFLDAQDRRQSEAIAASYAPLDLGRRGGGRAQPAKDLVIDPLPPGEQVYPRDLPLHLGGRALQPILAVRGQTVAIHLGVYARAPFTLHVEAPALAREGGGDAPPAPVIRHGRYLPMRRACPGPVWLEVDHYRPEPDFTVGPELARSLLVEYRMPDRGGGSFTGAIRITGGPEPIELPIAIRAVDVPLPEIPIPVGLFMNALPFRPGAVGGEAAWWRFQEQLLDEQMNAGLACVTGGPGVEHPLRAPPGAPDPAAHYLELAARRGPIKAVVAYGGFLPTLRQGGATPEELARFSGAAGGAPHFVKGFDEPATPEELADALRLVSPMTQAGVKTIGFFSTDRGGPGFGELVDHTYAVAYNEIDLAKIAGRKHVWVYNHGLDRWSLGAGLYREIQAGAEGRLEWIGIFTQGFAFDNLDGREASPAAWVVHDRFGPMPTPRWLAAREGLYDLRIRLALEAALPKGDPAIAPPGPARVPDAALAEARRAMLERLERGAAP